MSQVVSMKCLACGASGPSIRVGHTGAKFQTDDPNDWVDSLHARMMAAKFIDEHIYCGELQILP